MKYKIKNSYVESERKELYVLYVNDKPLCFDEDKGKLEVLLEWKIYLLCYMNS